MSTKTVCITGCSSGFGRVTALHLARLGWQVFATVRSDSDKDSLLAEAANSALRERLVPFVCDITNEADIASLKTEIGTHSPHLDALINNAGTAFPSPLEILPLPALRLQLEVNVVAQLAVTQVLLPFLKNARGKIVNVSSINGRIAEPVIGAYCMSKFAVEAMSDVLRVELAPFGIHVVVVEPGASPTSIWKTSEERGLAMTTQDERRDYQPLMDAVQRHIPKLIKQGFPPSLFAETIASILHDRSPHVRYCLPAKAAWKLLAHKILPDRLWDFIILKLLKK